MNRKRRGPAPTSTSARKRQNERSGPRGHHGPTATVGFQRKAVVGRPGDRFEQEADAVADHIEAGQPVPAISAVTAPVLAEEAPSSGGSVQTAATDETEAEPLETAATDETETEPLQTAATDETEVEPLQTAGGSPPSRATVPSSGGGEELPPATRSVLEPGIGTDLSAVRVHSDPEAHRATSELGARAFTHGDDIWLGAGERADDLGLMAHEAAHVVQQSGGSDMIQRDVTATTDETDQADPPPKRAAKFKDGDAIDMTDEPLITLKSFPIPEVKRKHSKMPASVEFPYGKERDTNQDKEWTRTVGAQARERATGMLSKVDEGARDEAGRYYLKNEKSKSVSPIIGTSEDIAELAVRPMWDQHGTPQSLQIDHIREAHLGGVDTNNLWLLEQSANADSGNQIQRKLASSINSVLVRAAAEKVQDVPKSVKKMAPGQWTIRIESFTKMEISGHPESHWDADDVAEGKPLEQLASMSEEDMKAAGGSAETLVIYFGPSGGERQDVPWGEEATTAGARETPGKEAWWFYRAPAPGETKRRPRKGNPPSGGKVSNIQITRIEYSPGKGGKLHGTLFPPGYTKHAPMGKEFPIGLAVYPKLEWAAFMEGQSAFRQVKNALSLPGLSPITLDDMAMDPDKGLVARGRLMPTVPLIAAAEIDVVIDGANVYLSKLFSGEDFDFPGPVEVRDTSLELRLGTEGLAILGETNFEIPNVGTGRLHGAAGADTEEVSFELGGEFDFLSEMFEPARIEVWYRDGRLGGFGELGVPPDRVRGLKSAHATVSWEDGVLTAEGTFEPDLPGIGQGALAFRYGEDGSVFLGGTLELTNDIPGIEGGRVEARVERDGEGTWHVRGAITAQPSVPGIDGEVTGSYDDGLFEIRARAAYERGMAAGTVTLGVTNRAVDEGGQPTGEPGAELTAFGGGQVTLGLAPWLQASAGLLLLPNGEIEVTGEIGLPAVLEVFPEKTFEKNIFSVNLDIPVFGIAAAGRRVGIFATVGGGLDARAGIGPGQLRDMRLGVVYNPDHEEDTTVSGHAGLHMPASAGLRLFIRGGLGAGIPLVSATLGLEIGGELGIQAAIGAQLDIDWTPTTGLVLDAVAEASAEPKFRFDITGFAEVTLDLLLREVTLYEQRWQLAAFEYGSNLRLGMRFPVHYQEGQPFEPSLDDIEFQIPDINPRELLTDLTAQFA